MSKVVVGWIDTYGKITLPVASLTDDRKRALIERIRKRKYNFGYNEYQYLPYCQPVYDDGMVCMMTKQQFENIMDEAWKDMRINRRLLPMDAITIPVKNGVLYEKEKFMNKES